MARLEFCTRCGAARAGALRFCRGCGLDLEAAVSPGIPAAGGPPAAVVRSGAADSSPAGPPSASWRPRTGEPTPTLERFGRDLTRQASEGRLGTIVGRDAEVELVIETLCRSQKRNPALVGPAGTGKTAIVERLAQRVVAGDVPPVLLGSRVVQLIPSTLVAGAGVVGELETRLKSILAEAAQDGIVLFIDEVHSIVGAGGARGTGDIASLLKPALARGEIACIAATTDDEYRTFIEADAALERRFNPVRVHELDTAETLVVVRAHRDDLVRLRGVHVPDEVLTWLVDFAGRAMPNRRFPDKAIDLVEQCVANGVAHGRTEVGQADAETVVRRMVGVPTNDAEGLATLARDLADRRLLSDVAARALVDRLRVTLNGLDARPARPNAVILLLGDAAGRADELCGALSSALFGTPGRVVTLDLGQMGEAHDTTLLLGAPPGYVGYAESLPIHEIAQMPWSIVRFEDADAAHPRIRELIAEAFAAGWISDATGRRIYLSDTVAVLTAAAADTGGGRHIGFGSLDPAHTPTDDDGDPARVAERVLGPELAAQVDLVVRSPTPAADLHRWLEDVLLTGLRQRCAQRGIDLGWDASLVDWLAVQRAGQPDLRGWERLVDEKVGSQLAVALANAGTSPGRVQERRLTVAVVDGAVSVSEGARSG